MSVTLAPPGDAWIFPRPNRGSPQAAVDSVHLAVLLARRLPGRRPISHAASSSETIDITGTAPVAPSGAVLLPPAQRAVRPMVGTPLRQLRLR